jgi:hypothetical protein
LWLASILASIIASIPIIFSMSCFSIFVEWRYIFDCTFKFNNSFQRCCFRSRHAMLPSNGFTKSTLA